MFSCILKKRKQISKQTETVDHADTKTLINKNISGWQYQYPWMCEEHEALVNQLSPSESKANFLNHEWGVKKALSFLFRACLVC